MGNEKDNPKSDEAKRLLRDATELVHRAEALQGEIRDEGEKLRRTIGDAEALQGEISRFGKDILGTASELVDEGEELGK